MKTIELTKDEIDILLTILEWQYPLSKDSVVVTIKKKLLA